MKYAVIDNKGFPLGFYSEDVHDDIPEEAIEITDEQWQEFLNHQGKRRWDGSKVVEYERVYTDAELAAGVRAKRDRLLKEFDTDIYCNEFRWADYSEDEQSAYTAYRQALRDITNQPEFPVDVVFPQKP